MATKLGAVAIQQNRTKRYLQGDTERHLRCSNDKVNQEETWWLWEIDKANNIYGFTNWRRQNDGKPPALRAESNTCAIADAGADFTLQMVQWKLIAGKDHGVPGQQLAPGVYGVIGLQNVSTGRWLAAQNAGHNTTCGTGNGEVGCGWPNGDVVQPVDGNANHDGWWVVLPSSDQPAPGMNPWEFIVVGAGGLVGAITSGWDKIMEALNSISINDDPDDGDGGGGDNAPPERL